MAATILNDTHTRRRMPHLGSNYKHFIHIVDCPNDPVIEQPCFPRGGHFDRSTFAATLQENCYPGGMIVNLYRIDRENKENERWVLCKVYGGKGKDESQYLHECDDDGFLVEGGVMFKSSGSSTPNLVEFKKEKDLEYYMSLPYEVVMKACEDGDGFEAEIPMLRGVVAWGKTEIELADVLNEAKETWFEIALKDGWDIPEPVGDNALF